MLNVRFAPSRHHRARHHAVHLHTILEALSANALARATMAALMVPTAA